jgi:sugar/nucleoside kinase (ribokinase family)
VSEGGRVNQEGDVVLIHYRDKPMAYARVETIRPDSKKDWFHVTLLLLTIPAQAVTWILKEEYINGNPFTMGGQSMRLEKVERVSGGGGPGDDFQPHGPIAPGKSPKVVAFKKQH